MEASLVAYALAGAKAPIASLLADGREYKAKAEAPIYLSLDSRALGGWPSSFLNAASHHEANSGVSEGITQKFSKWKLLILSLLLNSQSASSWQIGWPSHRIWKRTCKEEGYLALSQIAEPYIEDCKARKRCGYTLISASPY